jgi:hypothetical protein
MDKRIFNDGKMGIRDEVFAADIKNISIAAAPTSLSCFVLICYFCCYTSIIVVFRLLLHNELMNEG